MNKTDGLIRDIRAIKEKYQSKRAALLPALYLAQREFGWLSPEALEFVAEALDVPKASIKGTATFYAMFKNKPVGRHLIQLCTNVACMIMGAERLVDLLRDKYGIEPNGTSADGRFSLVIMECIGACDTAPAMLINEDFYDNLNKENIIDILENYK
ncbi:MAG: NADH-quinone oxidoreductase subunit NuoE [Thermodesulfovibrionales bacterium]|nr:NADH-quinone oxidoreductase subunit NuoE [Thermodesulfovibrionales bacterium]